MRSLETEYRACRNVRGGEHSEAVLLCDTAAGTKDGVRWQSSAFESGHRPTTRVEAESDVASGETREGREACGREGRERPEGGVGACRAEIAEIANGGSALQRESSGRFSAATVVVGRVP